MAPDNDTAISALTSVIKKIYYYTIYAVTDSE